MTCLAAQPIPLQNSNEDAASVSTKSGMFYANRLGPARPGLTGVLNDLTGSRPDLTGVTTELTGVASVSH
eukprot:3229743-Amphidinium_carterae.1